MKKLGILGAGVAHGLVGVGGRRGLVVGGVPGFEFSYIDSGGAPGVGTPDTGVGGVPDGTVSVTAHYMDAGSQRKLRHGRREGGRERRKGGWIGNERGG